MIPSVKPQLCQCSVECETVCSFKIRKSNTFLQYFGRQRSRLHKWKFSESSRFTRCDVFGTLCITPLVCVLAIVHYIETVTTLTMAVTKSTISQFVCYPGSTHGCIRLWLLWELFVKGADINKIFGYIVSKMLFDINSLFRSVIRKQHYTRYGVTVYRNTQPC